MTSDPVRRCGAALRPCGSNPDARERMRHHGRVSRTARTPAAREVPRRLTVVFVPGLGLGPESVRQTRRWLRTPSVVRCLPGFGLPAGEGTDLRPPALAERLIAALHRDRLSAVVLVGHSSSCQIVAEAARLSPDLVKGLLLIGPTSDVRASSWRQLVLRWVRTAVRERPWEVPPLVRQYTRTGLGSMRRAMNEARHHDIRQPLVAAACPVVAVRGSADRISPVDWMAELATLSSGDADTLDSGGHMIVMTHGDQVAARLDALVQRLSAT